MESLKIGMFTRALPHQINGGREARVQYVVNYLRDAGHEVHVYTTPFKLSSASGHRDYNINRVQVHERGYDIGTGFPWWTIRETIFALNTFRERKHHFDILDSTIPTLSYLGDATVRVAHMDPYISQVSKFLLSPTKLLDPIYSLFSYWVVRRYLNGIITYNHLAMRELRRLFPSQVNFKVISAGIDDTLFTPKNISIHDINEMRIHTNAGDRPFILFVGGVGREKGVHHLIDALPYIWSKVPNVAVVIAGGKLSSRLIQRAKKRGIIDAITFAGRIPHEKLPALYSAATVTVLPSEWETYPLTLLESLAMGTPVVASDIGGIPEIVKHGVTGLLFPPRDIDTLAKNLVKLILDDEMRNRFSKNTPAPEEVSLKKTAHETEKFYKHLLEITSS